MKMLAYDLRVIFFKQMGGAFTFISAMNLLEMANVVEIVLGVPLCHIFPCMPLPLYATRYAIAVINFVITRNST